MNEILYGQVGPYMVRLINLSKHLDEKKETNLSDQIFYHGTEIGAYMIDASNAMSEWEKRVALNKSLGSAEKVSMLLKLMKDSKVIDDKAYASMDKDSSAVIQAIRKLFTPTK